jgi:hypothetical protein
MRTVTMGLLLAALAGCAHTVETRKAPERSAELYYPLAVGNSWTYDVTFLGEQREDTITFVKSEDGYLVDNKGNKLTADAYGVRDDKRYLIQEPVEADHTWKNVVSVSETEHYKILSVGEPCEAPAGKWPDCVVVQGSQRVQGNAELRNTLTFARGVGLVRVAVDLARGSEQLRQTELALKSFKLAPPSEGKKP